MSKFEDFIDLFEQCEISLGWVYGARWLFTQENQTTHPYAWYKEATDQGGLWWDSR